MKLPPEDEGLIVDLFAGGGGASLGVEAAFGRPVDLAVNHNPIALAVHMANHPQTRHFIKDVWEVDPREATGGRRVRFLWASPDCKDFSRAKGGKPVSKRVRGLAWVINKWAEETGAEIVCGENVPEFEQWGPLDKNGDRIKSKLGQTFRKWRRGLEQLGYAFEYRVLDASHYGAPTKRRRLYFIARRDGQPIVWPKPTHGPGLKPFRTAAECIDWSIPCPSIFERKKPLAPKTLARIAEGIRRYVIDNPKPFIVGVGGRAGQSPPTGINSPVGTITAKNDRAVVMPVLATIDHRGSGDRAVTAVGAPLPTITVKNRHALAAATLIQTGFGERKGQRARSLDIEQPLGTVVAQGKKHALVAAFIEKNNSGKTSPGAPLEQPISTVTARDHHALVAATLATFRGTSKSHPGAASIEDPLPTVSAGGVHGAVVSAELDPIDDLAALSAEAWRERAAAMTGRDHRNEVRAFLIRYQSQGGQWARLDEPMVTIVTKDRLGLVTVEGVDYQIVDIGLRMLVVDELKRAQFGDYAEGYDLSAAPTQADGVMLLGNSVCPVMAEAIAREQIRPREREAVAA